jgi:TIR domain
LWTVKPLRAGNLQLALVITYGESATPGVPFRETRPGDIVVEALGGGVSVAEVLGVAVSATAIGAVTIPVIRRRRGHRTPHEPGRNVPLPIEGAVVAGVQGAPSMVFLSYSRADLEEANRIEAELEAHGFKTWRDVDDIHADELWRQAIADAMDQVLAVVLLKSTASGASKQVDREIVLADEAHKTIIPLLIEGSYEFHGQQGYVLAGKQVLDMRGEQRERGMLQLLEGLAAVVARSTQH